MKIKPLRPGRVVRGCAREGRLAARYTAVSLVGFAVDATCLQAGLSLGLGPAWARVASLALAMQATFLLNGRHVFGSLGPGRAAVRQWATYMGTNAFGNLCNYWIFVTLVSTHWRIVGEPAFALCAGSACAWALNYGCTRWLVFGRAVRLGRTVLRRAGERRRRGAVSRAPARRVPRPAAPRCARR